jgi:recombinational DNA repair protein (RecF pathway)
METTEAIILKVAPYSETTLLVTMLTREQGVVRALAKGARRTKGGSVQAAFEPFAWVQAGLRLKRPDGLGVAYNVSLEQGWPYLRRDVERLAYAGLGIEILGGLATRSPAEPVLFDEALVFLENLEKAAGPGSLVIALLLRLLHEAGFLPQLAEPWTEETLPPALTYHFDRGMFDAPHPHDSSHTMRLTKEAVAPLLGALAVPPPLDGSWTLGAQAGQAILRWLIRVWEDHLNEPLQSAKFLEKMVLRAH